MAIKSIPANQQKTVIDSVNNLLQYAERTGTVRRTGKDGQIILWALIQSPRESSG